MIIKQKVHVYYQTYGWMTAEQRIQVSSYDLDETDKNVKVGETTVDLEVPDFEANPELLIAMQVAVLQKQKEKIKEETLEKLAILEDKLQSLIGIEHQGE